MRQELLDIINVDSFEADKQQKALDRLIADIQRIEDADERRRCNAANHQANWERARRVVEMSRMPPAQPQYREDRSYGDDLDACCGGGQGHDAYEVEDRAWLLVGVFAILASCGIMVGAGVAIWKAVAW